MRDVPTRPHVAALARGLQNRQAGAALRLDGSIPSPLRSDYRRERLTFSHRLTLSARSTVAESLRPAPQSTVSRFRLRAVIESFPAPPSREPADAPPSSLSFPAPPSSVSRPASPFRVSLPAPPNNLSLPLPPRSESLPPAP